MPAPLLESVDELVFFGSDLHVVVSVGVVNTVGVATVDIVSGVVWTRGRWIKIIGVFLDFLVQVLP